MIDLETMGLAHNAAIISIGVTHFNATEIKDTFYTNVLLQSCIDVGLSTTPSTVDWWKTQSEDARSAWDDPHAPSIIDALKGLQDWMYSKGNLNDIVPWGNGADFDITILRNAFEAVAADPPWKYWNHRCFRTLKGVFPVVVMPREGTHHNALDDAKHQTKILQVLAQRHNINLD